MNNDACKRLDEHLARLIYRLEKGRTLIRPEQPVFKLQAVCILNRSAGFIYSLFIHQEIIALVAAIIFIISLGIIAHFHAKLDNGRKRLKVWKDIKLPTAPVWNLTGRRYLRLITVRKIYNRQTKLI